MITRKNGAYSGSRNHYVPEYFEFHEKDQKEKEQLQIAYEKADMESKTKTEFMNRMSHDLRTRSMESWE